MVAVMYIPDNGLKISHMEKALICKPPMVNNTKVIGLKINKMALALKHIETVLVSKDNLNKEKNMDWEYLIGLTDVCIKDSFMIIICMAQVNLSGLMADLMMVNGRKIKWMAKEYLNGQMVENI